MLLAPIGLPLLPLPLHFHALGLEICLAFELCLSGFPPLFLKCHGVDFQFCRFVCEARPLFEGIFLIIETTDLDLLDGSDRFLRIAGGAVVGVQIANRDENGAQTDCPARGKSGGWLGLRHAQTEKFSL